MAQYVLAECGRLGGNDHHIRPLDAPASRNSGVLSRLANLSNGGVLTPPGAANAMLYPLPQDQKISDKNHKKANLPKGDKGARPSGLHAVRVFNPGQPRAVT